MKTTFFTNHVLLALGLAVTSLSSAAPAQMSPELAQASPDSAHMSPPIQTTPMTGGEGSVRQFDHNAYSEPLGNMEMMKRLDFSVGNSFFRNPWVQAPASTTARDGLGPIFNTNSCQGCHIKDGRGNPPVEDGRAISLFLRLAIPANPQQDAAILKQHGFVPAPVYGSQLQTAALPDMQPEADLEIDYRTRTVTLDDGSQVELREPSYDIRNPNYGPLPDDLMISPRVAPPMIGLGLLEVIPAAAIVASADPDDSDADGISGRPNRVWDRAAKETVVGRFGWKASEPSIRQQSLGAFAGDMGLTSHLFPTTDCTTSQGCDDVANGGTPEVSDKIADFITFYASSLAVPQRRNLDDPAVMAGAKSFNAIGCATCHTPRHTTAAVPGRPALGNQIIWPYTDLLLHDMGSGLADGRPEFLANGREWRTPPLWGIGLAQQINPLAGFLHDGRARTLEEAILWHGGEARVARERYKALDKTAREALIRFLNSL